MYHFQYPVVSANKMFHLIKNTIKEKKLKSCIFTTQKSSLFSTYQIENCCANADGLSFGVFI